MNEQINKEEYINSIKEKIRTINPEITDELLDLLYEYVIERFMGNIRH